MNKQRGFTLIELLVVIAIISLLSSVVIASLNNARVKARDARRMSDLNEIDNAVQLYIAQNGHAPYLGKDCSATGPYNTDDRDCVVRSTNSEWSVLASDLSPFISKLPEDPQNNSDIYYVYAAPYNISSHCNFDQHPADSPYCKEIFGSNTSYGLYGASESKGGFGEGWIPDNIFYSRSTPRSFLPGLGSS